MKEKGDQKGYEICTFGGAEGGYAPGEANL